ncbi:MAG: SPFH domain-containing protein [Anaerolineae bacterium]|nr:SPFH domain-containing protein [Anaerolineae bacterium]
MVTLKQARRYLKNFLFTVGLVIVGISLISPILAPLLTGMALGLWGRVLFGGMVAFPLVVALTLVFMVAASFLNRVYDIRSLLDAHRFLQRLLFGTWYFGPYLLIKEGKIARGADTVLHRIGGPGFLVIYNDSAVITERAGRLYRILATNLPKRQNYPLLEPFEKIWEIVDLRPQQWTFPVRAMTRDGIPVVCEADVRFKIDDRILTPDGQLTPKPPTDEEPYPFTPEAVFKAATARWIREPDFQGPPMDWRGRVVVGFTEGILRNILAEYRLDWLLSPTGENDHHPRKVIRERLQRALEEEALKVGARILDVQLGEIRVEDDQIPAQWVEAWRTEWESRTAAARVEGEAELLRIEAARTQAQAEMIITLIRELQSAAIGDKQIRSFLLAARLAERLRWMSYDPFTRAFLPPESLRTLQRLQQILEEDRALPPAGGVG